ncbi:MAG: serine/threonine-protein kinase [Gemmatimonadetes bacterium]|nr:serine/threonine-protein kinase [Gemmatimonadota bacterium]
MSQDIIARLNAALEGRYRIEAELGEGGMATVYLADDLRHERKVAVKVLKPELSAVVGAERFLAEIKTTANLQHPHILPLFDSGEADGFVYYVMPYIEGETLRERIERDKQLPVDEAVRIATAVANALHTAHRAGVVHRDIKPGNILMSNGEPLVADFGIALAVGTAGGSRLTETGLSVGTPFYMSPEQATGDQAIGAASDIYALAAVLYELLVGEPPYVGNTAQAVLGKILQGDTVSATTIRKTVPANVDAALRKALEKLPADRFTDAQDFAKALSDPAFRHGTVAASIAGSPGPWKAVALGSGAVALFALLALGWSTASRPDAPDRPIERFEMPFRSDQAPVAFGVVQFALSADGSALAYLGPPSDAPVPQVWVRRWDDPEAVPVRGAAGPTEMAISGDGSLVAVSIGAQIRVFPVGGGPEVDLGPGNFPWFGPDGMIYYSLGTGIARAPATGGAVDTIIANDSLTGGQGIRDILPSGKALNWGVRASDGLDWIYLTDIESGTNEPLVQGLEPRYVDSGHLLFLSEGVLMAAPFDEGAGELTGPAVPLIEDVAGYEIALDGKLVYSRGGVGSLQELVWVDRDGDVTPVEQGWSVDTGGSNAGWSLSSDGRRIAIRERTEEGLDIWVKELDGGPRSRLTFEETEDRKPVWGPEDGYVTFLSNRNGESTDVWRRRADGTGQPELVLDLPEGIAEIAWSEQGDWLVMRTIGTPGQRGGRDVQAREARRDAEPIPLLMEAHDEISPSLSPNGRWLVYASNETGSYEIFVRPFPDVESARWQVSTNGGIAPKWSRDGTEIFFLDGSDQMSAARVETGDTFEVLERSVLFPLPPTIQRSDIYIPYDVGLDGERQLLMARGFTGDGDEEGVAPPFVLVNNWLSELQRIMPR